MTTWNGHRPGQRVGIEPANTRCQSDRSTSTPTLLSLTVRPCDTCGRPVALRRPGVLGVRVPVYCRPCRVARRAWEIVCDLAGAAAWAGAIYGAVWLWLWLGGAR